MAGEAGAPANPHVMRKLLVSVVLTAGLVAGAAATPAGAVPDLPPKLDPAVLSGPSPRAIVMFDHRVDVATIGRLSTAGIERVLVFDAIDAVAVLGPRASYIDIARWDDVSWVDDDTPIEFHNHVAKVDTGVDRVRAGERPLETSYTGEGVTVAVVDSGVDTTHPDLIDRIAVNVDMEHAPLVDPATGGAYSTTYSERPAGTDEYGHGTHVAGIVGGSGSVGQGADLSGVAPGATLINCKLGLSTAFETSALACYQWILDHRTDPRFPGGIGVATNSWGLGSDLTGARPLEVMVRKVTRAGITLVFSAGNSGPMQDGESTVVPYPNRMEEVVTVGATCKSKESSPSECDPLGVASFSSRGPEVDVAAPGVDIWSTRPGASAGTAFGLVLGSQVMPGASPADQAANRAFYIGISGTSMSAPHVAGIVALMLQARPSLRPKQVESILIRTSADLGPRGFDVDYGHGFVDALAAVKAAERFGRRR